MILVHKPLEDNENNRKTQDLISYPYTKTNIFPKELNLTTLIEQQIE